METKHLTGKGEFDYDYRNDILFFKVKNREYTKSIDLDEMVLDIDSENFIVGLQMFEASKFLNIDKKDLLKVSNGHLEASVNDQRVEVRFIFQIKIRNKIVEKNSIIRQEVQDKLPNSELVCVAT